MSLNKVIEVARADLGYTESPPNSNNTKYGAAYGLQGQPWCVIFLWWLFQEAGEGAAFFGGAKTASCGTLLRWYKEQGLTVPVEDVQVGDIVILNFNGTKDTQHCGLVTRTSKVSATGGVVQITTIEGNTSSSDGSQSDGGCVCEKTRYPSQVVGVCRPQYQPEPEVKDDITGHWSEKNIRYCMEHGIMNGYPDGSFQPDRPVTRGELAAVLRRLTEM